MITAEGERKASQALREAGEVITGSPAAMQVCGEDVFSNCKMKEHICDNGRPHISISYLTSTRVVRK